MSLPYAFDTTSPLSGIPGWAENGHSRVPQIIAELHHALDDLIANGARAITQLEQATLPNSPDHRIFRLLRELPGECEKLGFDSLTGFPTLNAFQRALRRQLYEDRRHEENQPDCPPRNTICIFVDIDKLKLYNNVGDFAGDAAICALARLCRAIVRDGDVLARTRGDQFGLLLPDTSLGCGVSIATRILEGARDIKGLALPLRCSIGLAASTFHGNTPQTIELATLNALAAAKIQGRDQLCIA